MNERPDSPDATQAALTLAHRLLSTSRSEQPELSDLLGSIRDAFSAGVVGVAAWPGAEVLVRLPAPCDPAELPWANDSALLDRASKEPDGLCVSHAGGAALLFVFGGRRKPWLLWLEAPNREQFSVGERAAFGLLAGVLGRWLGQEDSTRWAEVIEQRVRQEQIEAAASVARRLAHDFGNVLTGILGFTELALTQPVPSHTPLHSYLQEVHRAAQHGASYTHQLRLFSRRHSPASRCSHLPQLLAEQEVRQLAAQPKGLTFRLHVPPELPAVAVDSESLHQVFGALLDNARDALGGEGSVGLSARTVELDEDECGRLYGAARPGPHVEVVIADTGSGLSAETQRRVLVEPFFTTRPRHKGFGLAVTYGILSAHRAGLRIHPGEERGTIVRVLLPVASAPVQPAEKARPPVGPVRGERILVVDDEPDILRYVATSLEQAGYRVQALGSADAAYQAYFAPAGEPFALLLTDAVMPNMSGVELVRRLVRRDPSARVLFMSGHVTPDFTQEDMTNHPYELLTKPFRSDHLLRTVRAVLDRGRRKVGTPEPGLTGSRK